MSGNRTSSGGVRNLRAMFEGGGDSASPPTPSRGRSPAGSDLASNGSNTPRRTSTVRTSFVSVDRSGQIGSQLEQTKSNESGSLVDKRRKSFSMNETQDPKAIAQVNETIETEKDRRLRSTKVDAVIPEVAVESPAKEESKQLHSTRDSPKKASSKPTSVPSGKGGQTASREEPSSTAKALKAVTQPAKAVAEKVTKAAKAGKDTMASKMTSTGKPGGGLARQVSRPELKKDAKGSSAPHDTTTSNGRAKEATSGNTAAAPKSRPSTSRTVPAPISVSKDSTTSKTSQRSSAKSPARGPRTPTTPKVATSNKPGSTATVATKSNGHAAQSSRAASTKASKPLTSAIGKPPGKPSTYAPRPLLPATQDSAFRKPKPKSPTRPVQLPASATAPTASSSAKTSSGSTEAPSRTSSQSKAQRGLKRQPSSSLKGPRHSLPVQSVPQRPSSRVSNVGSKAADESFLARMMRPTTSSSSKTHERAEGGSGHSPKRSSSIKATRVGGGSRPGSRVVSGESQTHAVQAVPSETAVAQDLTEPVPAETKKVTVTEKVVDAETVPVAKEDPESEAAPKQPEIVKPATKPAVIKPANQETSLERPEVVKTAKEPEVVSAPKPEVATHQAEIDKPAKPEEVDPPKPKVAAKQPDVVKPAKVEEADAPKPGPAAQQSQTAKPPKKKSAKKTKGAKPTEKAEPVKKAETDVTSAAGPKPTEQDEANPPTQTKAASTASEATTKPSPDDASKQPLPAGELTKDATKTEDEGFLPLQETEKSALAKTDEFVGTAEAEVKERSGTEPTAEETHAPAA